jgi:hypothetical protein
MLNQKLQPTNLSRFCSKSTNSSLKQEMGVSASLIIIVKNRVLAVAEGKRQSLGQLPWELTKFESESDVLDHASSWIIRKYFQG